MTSRACILLVLALTSLLGIAGTASASQPSLLFSTTSNDVRITGSGKAFTVSVPAAAQLAWFADRPARKAGVSTATALVDGWATNGFDTTPPNAALVTTKAGTSMQTIVVLRSPLRSGGRVSFRATVLPHGAMLGMHTNGRPANGRYAGELFVDSATVYPCSTGTTYVGSRFAQCYTSGATADYSFLNGAADGTQLTYACGAGLSVHHYAPSPNTTYSLQACPQLSNVGWATRQTFTSGSSTATAYGQNSYLGVRPGVTFTFSFDAPCGPSITNTSGTATCVLPSGSSVSITRSTAGNTRVQACSLSGTGSLTYDSTAAGVLGYAVSVSACDSYTAVADVPTTSATVIVHASADLKILTNAG